MSRGLVDTSIFIARETGRSIAEDALPAELAVSVITIGELRAGVLIAGEVETRDRRLATLTAALSLDPVPVGDDVVSQWAKLRVVLRSRGERMPLNASLIAATAMALGVPVVTRYGGYPILAELAIIRV
jgi:predicted nucleic acid-binding protein